MKSTLNSSASTIAVASSDISLSPIHFASHASIISTNDSCPNGIAAIHLVLHACVMSTRQLIAVTLGLASMAAWIIYSLPQIAQNCQNSAECDRAISAALLAFWLAGDASNLIGALLTRQLALQSALAAYQVATDFVLIGQFCGARFKRIASQKRTAAQQLASERFENAGDIRSLNEEDGEDDDDVRGGATRTSSSLDSSYFECGGDQKRPLLPGVEGIDDATSTSNTTMPTTTTNRPIILCCVVCLLFLGGGGGALFFSLSSLYSSTSYSALSSLSSLSPAQFPARSARRLLWFAFGVSPSEVSFSHLQLADFPTNQNLSNTDKSVALEAFLRLLRNDRARLIGYAIGCGSAAAYLAARIPQICLNRRRQSTRGLHFAFFLCALIGNALYAAQILVSSLEPAFLLLSLPWLAGSAGVLLLDLTILMQIAYYRRPRCRAM